MQKVNPIWECTCTAILDYLFVVLAVHGFQLKKKGKSPQNAANCRSPFMFHRLSRNLFKTFLCRFSMVFSNGIFAVFALHGVLENVSHANNEG